MNKTRCFLAAILAAISGVVNIYAASASDTEGLGNAKPQSSVSDYNYASFDINVTESGEYYAEFWLMPTQYADGTFTNYTVYVNDVMVGSIIPDKGNWQVARIANLDRISLEEGHNTINVAVLAPEIPSVETIKVALSDSEASISSSVYEDFCSMANEGINFGVPEEDEFLSCASDLYSPNVLEFATKHFFDVPLVYTFYVDFKFTEGTSVHLASSSWFAHDIDMFYVGQGTLFRPSSSVQELQADETTGDLGPIGDGNNTKVKNLQTYQLASSDEMQLLNWKCLSTKTFNSNSNTISRYITIPETGIYRIRIRNRESGKTGIVDLCVNDRYTYQNMPISFHWVACEMPANGMEYGTMTYCKDRDNDDPMIFIHGAAGDRVVGFNDDANSLMRRIHELSKYDSHIAQEYKVKTSGISVSNYSSLDPVSKCEIVAGVDESIFAPLPESLNKPKENKKRSWNNSNDPTLVMSIDVSMDQAGILNISSASCINRVIITDVSGKVIKSFDGDGNTMHVSDKALNLGSSGVYIVKVDTEKGSSIKKVMIK